MYEIRNSLQNCKFPEVILVSYDTRIMYRIDKADKMRLRLVQFSQLNITFIYGSRPRASSVGIVIFLPSRYMNNYILAVNCKSFHEKFYKCKPSFNSLLMNNTPKASYSSDSNYTSIPVNYLITLFRHLFSSSVSDWQQKLRMTGFK